MIIGCLGRCSVFVLMAGAAFMKKFLARMVAVIQIPIEMMPPLIRDSYI